MKIAIMGAGAVGCYYGGMLARAGHAVVLIGRPNHVAAIKRDGLWMDTQTFQAFVPVQASTNPADIAGSELVLCCVKAMDSERVAVEMAPWLKPDALLLSLQNGVDNAERLQARLPCRVAPVAVYVAAEMSGVGRVKHHGRGELMIGPMLESDALVKLFEAAGVPVQISDNIASVLWAKLVLNCAYNALSAITQMPYGVLVKGQGVETVMRDIVAECLAVARAEGIRLPGGLWQSVEGIALTMPAQLSSTAQDLARHKPSEIDFLNGHVVRRGEALGVPTPVNRVLHSLVRLLEGKANESLADHVV